MDIQNTIPNSLLSLITVHQPFIGTANSLLKLWRDIVQNFDLDENDEDLQEWYSFSYEDLDTWPKAELVNCVAKVVTGKQWPCNDDGEAYYHKFISIYKTRISEKYNIRERS